MRTMQCYADYGVHRDSRKVFTSKPPSIVQSAINVMLLLLLPSLPPYHCLFTEGPVPILRIAQ
ncbi:hypothetical protein N7453_002799 [Penicillium expansum]|nr:hypothetical protein N7453_002799 [Penicillium expansum]